MLPEISITCVEEPVPLPPCPPDLPALAAGGLKPLQEALRRGEETAVLTVCQWPHSPWAPAAGAYTVLKAAVDFLYDHPALRRLELRCAGVDCWRSYRFQWNMWFAERKEDPVETVTNL